MKAGLVIGIGIGFGMGIGLPCVCVFVCVALQDGPPAATCLCVETL